MAEVVAMRKGYSREDLAKLSARWKERITRQIEARKEKWYADAEYAEAAYSLGNDRGRVSDFNILFSNTETIVPAIFNSMPVPDIRERHTRGDEVARAAADVLENVVSVQIDDSALDIEVEDVARDAIVAGRGILRVRFNADQDEMGGVTNERVTYEAVSWRDYVEGPAARFNQLPWCAFKHRLSKAEQERISDRDVYERQQVEGEEDKRPDREDIWEVWDKKTRKVYFLRESDGRILSAKDDPLGLKNFFPVCRPVQPITLTGKRDPIVPYKLYRKLADELDKITRRINALIEGMKARGLLITGADDIQKLAQAGDNELVTASNLEALAQIGLDKAILWWPIERLIIVVKELYLAREQTKQAIYEITGISDIVRGASDARETATAQQVKTQWGSLRIKRLQKMIERMVREAFVLTVEMVASKFSAETIQQQAGIPMDEQILALIQDPLMNYRIDVESDSTVRGDLTRQKGEMAEFLKGTAEFFAVMQPVVAGAPQVAGQVVALYSSFARQFNLGRQAETALDELVQAAQQASKNPQQQPNPDAEAKQAEMAMKGQEMQGRMQLDAARLQMDRERMQMDVQAQAAKAQADAAKAATDVQLKREAAQMELQIKDRELAIKDAELELKRADLGLKEQDLGLRAQDMRLKERGMAMEETEREMEGERQDLAAALAAFAEQVAAMGQSIERGMSDMGRQIAEAQARPKKVVRDPKTRQVIGVE